MKLRFSGNSLRLRVNQREVDALAGGQVLEEEVWFPGGRLRYLLRSSSATSESVTFREGKIEVDLNIGQVQDWALNREAIGLYFEVRTERKPLKVAIEKDLVCIDGAPEEVDPYAFPRNEEVNKC